MILLKVCLLLLKNFLRELKSVRRDCADEHNSKCVFIPHIHGVSHNLMKLGGCAPRKLAKLCGVVNMEKKEKLAFTKQHPNSFRKRNS